MDIKGIITSIVEKKLKKGDDDPCWDGYVKLGTKKKDGKEVPNCVPKESVELDESKNVLVARYMNKDGNNVLYFEIWEKPNGNLYSKISNQRGLNIAASAIDLRSSHADAKRNVERAVMFYDQDGDSGALRHLNHLLPGWKKVPIQESADLSERVEVDHSRYMRSHSKKARGRGTWMFTTKDMGEPSEDEMVTVSGDLSTAAKEAAKKLGTKRVYVMEDTELDEAKIGDTVSYGTKIGGKIKIKKAKVVSVRPNGKIELDTSAILDMSDKVSKKSDIEMHHDFVFESTELDEAFNLEIGTKVAMKDKGKTIYGKIIGKEKVMGEPGVEVKWDSGVKGRFKMSAFAGLSMDRKADYIISESVELDEISNRLVQKVRDRAAERIAGGVGKTTKDPKTGLFKYVPPTEDEKALAQKGVKSFTATRRAIERQKKESVELDEAKTDVYHKHMLKALGKSRLPKNHSFTSAIADNGDFIVRDGGGRIVGRIPKGEHDLKESTELTEDVHNDLNDAIIEFQRKLMRMTRQLDPAIAKEVKKIDKDLDDLRTGPLFKIRPGR